MAEGALKPEIEDFQGREPENTASPKTTSKEEISQTSSRGLGPSIIWTPRFIVIFALMVVLGLSIESLLTQGWLNVNYTGQWIFQIHVIVVCSGWLALLVITRSNWIRLSSIFGIIWALFMTLNVIVSTQYNDLTIHVLSLLSAASCIALLGSYICLSIDKTPISRLDSWFFGLTPIIGSIAVAAIYFLTPSNERSLDTLENAIATIALILSLLVWWIRPTSWRSQPGPTFLFGCVPLILLILAVSARNFDLSNYFLAKVLMGPTPFLATDDSIFFFSQVALLTLFLGIMRVLQFERVTTITKKR